MPDLLFEAGMEEIPARMIAAAEKELTQRIVDLLGRERLLAEGHEVRSYSTPRRLAVQVSGLLERQPDATERMTGPAWSVAFKEGQPTAAAQAFARKAGVAVEALEKTATPKGDYVSATVTHQGRRALEVLGERLAAELAAIYWPKNMYWRAQKPERFVRPIRWIVAMLDHELIPVEFAGVRAGKQTFGHRILHGSEPVVIDHPDDYVGALEAAKVTADAGLRRHRIRKALDQETRDIPDARWRENAALVETVTHLTEWPSVVMGSFDREYLALPEEVLVTVMRDHQKYFAVENPQHKLEPYFLAVLNTHPEETGIETIRHGNERVLRARFNDARFFWNVDQKITLEDRVEMLKSVTFHKELGSYWDKTQANLRIAESLAATLAERGVALDAKALQQAVGVAKADLTTELVKEFTELQGIVGGLYARGAGARRDRRSGDLLAVLAGGRRRPNPAHSRRPGPRPRRPHPDDGGDVWDWPRADRFEGSLRAAPRCERHRQNPGGVRLAAANQRSSCGCGAPQRGSEREGRKLFPRASGVLPARSPRLCLRRGERGVGCRLR